MKIKLQNIFDNRYLEVESTNIIRALAYKTGSAIAYKTGKSYNGIDQVQEALIKESPDQITAMSSHLV